MAQMMFLINQIVTTWLRAWSSGYTFWEYMLFSENAEFTHKYLNEMSVLVVENELWAKLRQADIQNFFQ